MKIILIILLVALIIGGVALLAFFPKEVSFSSGFVAGDYYDDRCIGLYVEKYNEIASDGPRGGLCYGIVGRVLIKSSN